MNHKKLVFMWCGIVTIILITLPFALDWLTSRRPSEQDKIRGLFSLIFYVALITGGLIVSFKGRKPQVKLNVKKGFARIACLLSVLAFVGWCVFGVSLLIDETLYNVDKDSWVAFVLAFISVAVIWGVYLIVFWIIAPIVCWIANWITTGFESETENTKND